MTALATYAKLRTAQMTPEPKAVRAPTHKRLAFVVQKHRASHLHYDFRLEMEGVLKSWVLPKGPSLDPRKKRLAIRVEDHPYAYRNFEGTIPKGQYGAGDVAIWDRGTYRSAKGNSPDSLLTGLRKGALSLTLRGRKLQGDFALVRLKQPRRWLLIKKRDAFCDARDITEDTHPVKSRRTRPRARKTQL
jgi:bifunctional non-homologous end joining protein LigD